MTFWTVMVAIVLADAALASAARLSGVVAFAQAVLALASVLALPDGATLVHTNDAGMLIAAYRAGAWLNGRSAALALLYLAVGSIGARMIDGTEIADWRVLVLGAVRRRCSPGSWAATPPPGRAHRRGGAAGRTEQERAQQALTDAIAEERSAIARDLHDVIAHHVSAIGVHAGAAAWGFPPRGFAGRDGADGGGDLQPRGPAGPAPPAGLPARQPGGGRAPTGPGRP
ncbi:histidine kinase dimerization/phosphoacceptor domain-containing protein [Streptomyces sp. M19]